MNDEIWKDIKGYEGLYQISNYGRVLNVKRNHIKVACLNHKGYYKIPLYNNNKQKMCRVHRLVAQAFIPNPDNKSEVNHKDFNKVNNHVDNLEWTSGEENRSHYQESDKYKLWLQTVTK